MLPYINLIGHLVGYGYFSEADRPWLVADHGVFHFPEVVLPGRERHQKAYRNRSNMPQWTNYGARNQDMGMFQHWS